VFEAGQVGEHVRRWGHARMFSPFGWNCTPLGRQTLLREKPTREFPADADCVTGREHIEAYLRPLAESEPLRGCLRPGTRVLAVGRSGSAFRLLVRGPDGAERFEAADAVFDCTGTDATPNPVGDGGIPAAGEAAARPHVAFGLEDVRGDRRGHYEGRSVAVIGGGYTAAATVCELTALAEQNQSTWVVWLTRRPKGQPLPRLPNDPLKERDRLAARANALACRCDGNLEYHPLVGIDELHAGGPDGPFRIVGRAAGKPTTWEVERVIAAVGSRPDRSLAAALAPDEPGYFVLGAKAGDRGFLLRDGFEQVRRAFAALLGHPRLDLYAGRAV
jgi:hypothetical protein